MKKSLDFIQNIDQSFLKIPITHICTSPKQMRLVLNEELQISPSKIHFNYFRYLDTYDPEEVIIDCKTIKEIQYLDSKYVVRIIFRPDIYFKHFYHKEEIDSIFTNSIWFGLKTVDLDAYKTIIKSFQDNCISTFPILQIPQKLEKEFIEIWDKATVNSKDLNIPNHSDNKFSNGNEMRRVKRLKRLLSTPLVILDKKPKISNNKLVYFPTLTNSIVINESDLTCLISGRYLNDNIINWYLTYIYYEQLSQTQRDQTYFFNTFFSTELIGTPAQQITDTPSTRHARVTKSTNNFDIFSKNFIIIPIIEENHWFFAIVCFPWMAGMIDYEAYLEKPIIDSVKIPVNDNNFAMTIRVKKLKALSREENVDAKPCVLLFDSLDCSYKSRHVNLIREYLKSEWDAKRLKTDGPLIFEKNTCRAYSPSIRKQRNATDGGLYLLHCVEYFFKNPLKSFEIKTFKNGFDHWFDNYVIIRKIDLIKRIILNKTKAIGQGKDESDDKDSFFL